MSVREEIEKAAAVKRNRGEEDEDYAKRMIDKITELGDADWAKLSAGAQAWFNEAVDAMNDNKEIPAFPEAATKSARGRKATEEPAAWVPQAGEQVIVTTKRNKVFEGEFLELDGDTAVVMVGNEEMEFTADRVLSMVPATPEGGSDDDKGNSDAITDGSNVQDGDVVTLTTKRNAVVRGAVVEITDEVIVLDVDGKESEYDRSRVASIVIEGGGDPEDKAPEPKLKDWVKVVTKRNKEVEGLVVEIDGNILVLKTGKDGEVEVDMDTAKSIEVVPDEKEAPAKTRRGATEAAAPAARSTRATTAAPEKKQKVTNADNNGVSVTVRMNEILCENPAITSDALAKQLDKEKLVYKAATLMIVFKGFNKIIAGLKKNKHFK